MKKIDPANMHLFRRLHFYGNVFFLVTVFVRFFYSINPPSAKMHWLRRRSTEKHALQNMSCGILFHSSSKCFLSISTEARGRRPTLSSRTPHTQKSSGFKSGEDGGHSFFNFRALRNENQARPSMGLKSTNLT